MSNCNSLLKLRCVLQKIYVLHKMQISDQRIPSNYAKEIIIKKTRTYYKIMCFFEKPRFW
jgi:hypothetical protein